MRLKHLLNEFSALDDGNPVKRGVAFVDPGRYAIKGLTLDGRGMQIRNALVPISWKDYEVEMERRGFRPSADLVVFHEQPYAFGDLATWLTTGSPDTTTARYTRENIGLKVALTLLALRLGNWEDAVLGISYPPKDSHGLQALAKAVKGEFRVASGDHNFTVNIDKVFFEHEPASVVWGVSAGSSVGGTIAILDAGGETCDLSLFDENGLVDVLTRSESISFMEVVNQFAQELLWSLKDQGIVNTVRTIRHDRVVEALTSGELNIAGNRYDVGASARRYRDNYINRVTDFVTSWGQLPNADTLVLGGGVQRSLYKDFVQLIQHGHKVLAVPEHQLNFIQFGVTFGLANVYEVLAEEGMFNGG